VHLQLGKEMMGENILGVTFLFNRSSSNLLFKVCFVTL